jgi:hypothetical protein
MDKARLNDSGRREFAAIEDLFECLGELQTEATITHLESGSAYRATFDGVRHRRVALRVDGDESRRDLRPSAACRVDFELDTA